MLYILSLSFFNISTKFSYAQWENWREAVVYAWEVFVKNGSESDTALLSQLPTAKSSSVALAKSSQLVSSLAWCAGQYWAQLRVVGKPFLEQALRPKAACSTLDSKFPYFFVVAIAYTADCVSGPPHNWLFLFPIQLIKRRILYSSHNEASLRQSMNLLPAFLVVKWVFPVQHKFHVVGADCCLERP